MDEKITKIIIMFHLTMFEKTQRIRPHTISNLSNIPFNNDLNRFTLNF